MWSGQKVATHYSEEKCVSGSMKIEVVVSIRETLSWPILHNCKVSYIIYQMTLLIFSG